MQNDAYGSVVLAATQMFVDERLPKMGDESLFRLLETSANRRARAGVRARCGLWEFRGRIAHPHLFRDAVLVGLRSRSASIARRLNIADRAQYWARGARATRERF